MKILCYFAARQQEVTVLIGVSYQGRPVAGIIHQPFWGTDAVSRTIWAIKGLGVHGIEIVKSTISNSSSSFRECAASFHDIISIGNFRIGILIYYHVIMT